MPEPQGEELARVRARREELRQRYLRPLASRPGSTRTGCPSPRGVTDESHGQVSQKAQNSGRTRTSSNRSAVDGGGSVATDICLLLCVVRRYTDAVFANRLSVPRPPSVLRPSHDGSTGQTAQLY